MRSARKRDRVSVVPVHTAVAGRMRVKVSRLYRAEASIKREIEWRLRLADGIESASASTLTGTVLVAFDSGRTHEAVLRLIERELGRIDAPDLASPPGPEDQPRNGSDGTFVESMPLGEDRHAHVSADITFGEIPPRRPWHAMDRESTLGYFHTSPAEGLASGEAAARVARFGPNAIPQAQPRSALSVFLAQFASLPVALLGATTALSVLTGGLIDATVILGVVLLNAGIGYLTERQSERAIGALAHLRAGSVSVLRDQVSTEVPIEAVTLGDVLLLAPGKSVAADARLIKTKRLTLDESQLTGESMPVRKSAKLTLSPATPLAERKNMVYRGARVTGGGGVGVVVASGRHTQIGMVQALAETVQAPQTPMQVQLDRLGAQLVMLSGLICAAVFMIGLARGYGGLQMLKSTLSLAVAALPEGLPTVATTTLALGIRTMRRHRVLIRELRAVETLGAVQVLCLDKTGTLTMNRMSATDLYLGAQRIKVNGGEFLVSGAPIEPAGSPDLQQLLRVLTLCNEATVDGEESKTIVNGSSTEGALLELALKGGVDIAALRASYPLHKMHYRSADRFFMRTTHETTDGRRLAAVKGNPRQVLSMCRWRLQGGEAMVLSDEDREAIAQENERMAGEALRVLGIAYAEAHRKPHKEGLTWVGLVGMRDPVRPGIESVIRQFHAAGIQPVMITGDQSATARAVGQEIGLSGTFSLELVDSSHIEALGPDLVAHPKRRVHVFSRINPAQKLEIVSAFQQAGKVVAMSGDGINDGPALKGADIGIAIGGPGNETARSVADMILEGERLDAILTAVGQGRTIYGNIRKSIHFLLATNLSEIELTLAGVVMGMGAPLTPMQLLWINLFTDVFPGLALALEPPEADVLERPPRDPKEPIIPAGILCDSGASPQ
jgi:Cation transport ATPase